MATTIDPPIIETENSLFEFNDSGKDLFKRLRYIPNKTDYWFVRTDGGIYFQNYIENNFIGIGWNEITFDDLRNKSQVDVKSKIETVEKLDPNIVKSKAKITSIYNKLIRFQKIKKGDIIVVPVKDLPD